MPLGAIHRQKGFFLMLGFTNGLIVFFGMQLCLAKAGTLYRMQCLIGREMVWSLKLALPAREHKQERLRDPL